MLTCHTFFLQTSVRDEVRQRTLDSLALAGAEPEAIVNCLPEQISRLVTSSATEVIHIIQPGTIVLPEFYRAMLATLEHSGKDFVVCLDGMLSRREIIKAGDKNFNPAQVIVRRWVYQEMGIGDEAPDVLVSRVLGEYRGCEVPHMLTMRI